MSVHVSVVVPTFRRPDLLARCLRALAQQDLSPEDYEVLVADDAASPDTRGQVETFAAEAKPRLFRYLAVTGHHGPAAARNAGWRAARGEVIAFTDDDTVPDPSWLRAGLEALTDGPDGVWGRIIVPLSQAPTDYERNEAGLERAEAATANCFYRRAALEAVGGFDERFTAAWREDADLFFTLLERGYRIEKASKAVVVHPVRPAPWGVSLGQQRKSRFNALLYQKHPNLYRQRIQARPPWNHYATVAALLLTVALIAAGRLLGALVPAAVWLGLTAEFFLRRLRGTSHSPRHVLEMAWTSVLIPPLAVFWRLRGALEYRVRFL
jgi:glycosyltransferase involved in cell wall biosynthesis